MPLKLRQSVKQALKWMEGPSTIDAPVSVEGGPRSSPNPPQDGSGDPQSSVGSMQLVSRSMEEVRQHQRLKLQLGEKQPQQWSPVEAPHLPKNVSQSRGSPGTTPVGCVLQLYHAHRLEGGDSNQAYASYSPHACAAINQIQILCKLSDVRTKKDGLQFKVLGLVTQLAGKGMAMWIDSRATILYRKKRSRRFITLFVVISTCER